MAQTREDVTEKRRFIDLSGAVLPNANFSHADFAHANLEGSNLPNANLTMAILASANLKKAILSGASLAFADLTDSDLTGSDLSEANLNKAIFQNANLLAVNFRNTDMRGADLKGAQNLSWSDLLHGRVDEKTVTPAYLDEKTLFETLNSLYEKVDWEKEYSGCLPDLWAELNRISDSMNNNSFHDLLITMRVHEEMAETERQQ